MVKDLSSEPGKSHDFNNRKFLNRFRKKLAENIRFQKLFFIRTLGFDSFPRTKIALGLKNLTSVQSHLSYFIKLLFLENNIPSVHPHSSSLRSTASICSSPDLDRPRSISEWVFWGCRVRPWTVRSWWSVCRQNWTSPFLLRSSGPSECSAERGWIRNLKKKKRVEKSIQKREE